MTYTRDDRSPYVISMSARNVADPPQAPNEHPCGYVNLWDEQHEGEAEQYLRNHFWNEHSNRLIMHWPFGRGAGPSAPTPEWPGKSCPQWWPAEQWRRELMQSIIEERKKVMDGWTFEVYGQARQFNPWHRTSSDDWVDLHPDNDVAKKRFNMTWLPWIAMGVHRIWLDNSSSPHKRTGFHLFARWVWEEYGVILGMEAVPLHLNGAGDIVCIDQSVWDDCPTICWNQFPLLRDNFPLQFKPKAHQEGVIVASNHVPKATAQEIKQWRKAGWIVGSGSRAFDPLVFGPIPQEPLS